MQTDDPAINVFMYEEEPARTTTTNADFLKAVQRTLQDTEAQQEPLAQDLLVPQFDVTAHTSFSTDTRVLVSAARFSTRYAPPLSRPVLAAPDAIVLKRPFVFGKTKARHTHA